MGILGYALIFFGIFCAVMGLLYQQGIAVMKSVRAILFVFRPGKDKTKAALDSCTGWVRHVGRFRESRTYEFSLTDQLSRGDVDVTLLDRNKQPLLQLNREQPVQKVSLNGKDRYYLYWVFRSATGRCELHWQ